MAASLDEFRDSLLASGMLSADVLEQFEQSLSEDGLPNSAETLALALVSHRRLTKYQAAHLFQGNPLPLVLGNYVIRERIGAGGMGRVYKAHHRRLDRLAAIKLLPRDMMDSPDAIRRFQQEVKAAARLSHPNIVLTYDADEQDGFHYLVMEYVQGKSLAGIVKGEGPLPIELALECIRQAAEGLAYAHQRGIIHRDIKPANLLLLRESESGTVSTPQRPENTIKILDMGLARISNAIDQIDHEGSGLTRTGQIMGSVDYMSPEQALDTRSADERSDIYSLGCTMYVLLTGKIPYYAKGLMKRLRAHREEPTPLASEVRPDVPVEVAEFCRRMMAKEPDLRPTSMSEVAGFVGRLRNRPAQVEGVDAGAVAPPPRRRDSDSLSPPPRVAPRKPVAPPRPRQLSPPPVPPPARGPLDSATQLAEPPPAHDSNLGGNTVVAGIADPTATPTSQRDARHRKRRRSTEKTQRPWLVTVVVVLTVVVATSAALGGLALLWWYASSS